MCGEFIGVWSETWREILAVLAEQEDVPDDINCEIYRELADVIDDPLQCREALQAIGADMLAGFTPYLTDQLNADSMYRGR